MLFPTISVVHPAYHCAPNGGHGNFLPSGNLLFSCVLVFATVQYQYTQSGNEAWFIHSAGYVIATHIYQYDYAGHRYIYITPISVAPAREPAIIDRRALGCFSLDSTLVQSSIAEYLLLLLIRRHV
jgi:hypothetical protein